MFLTNVRHAWDWHQILSSAFHSHDGSDNTCPRDDLAHELFARVVAQKMRVRRLLRIDAEEPYLSCRCKNLDLRDFPFRVVSIKEKWAFKITPIKN